VRTLGFLLTAAIVPGVLAGPIAAQNSFEGVIDYEMSGGDGMDMDVKTTIKGTRVRQDLQGGPMGTMITLVDAESMVMTMLMPAQKTYMRFDPTEMLEQHGQAAHEVAPKPEEFQSTGEKETIAGHACEHYAYNKDGMTIDMCIASGLGFMPFSQPGAMSGRNSPAPGGLADFSAWRARFGDGFVVLAVETTQNGATTTMRAKSIERKSVSDDLFEVPSDYTQMKMPGGPGR